MCFIGGMQKSQEGLHRIDVGVMIKVMGASAGQDGEGGAWLEASDIQILDPHIQG